MSVGNNVFFLNRLQTVDWSHLHPVVLALAYTGVLSSVGSHLLFGNAEQYLCSALLFQRLSAVVLLLAFASFWVQCIGCVGENGIEPLADKVSRMRKQGWVAFPTIFRRWPTNQALHIVHAIGCGIALVLLFDLHHLLQQALFYLAATTSIPFLPTALALFARLLSLLCSSPVLFAACYLLYLSVRCVAGVFMCLQFDNLILETAALAACVSFATSLLPSAHYDSSFSSSSFSALLAVELAMWAVWWLNFRILYSSGLVKIVCDRRWRDGSAMLFHYWSQPIPNPGSYFAHWYVPAWLHRLSAWIHLVIELLLPWVMFLPAAAATASSSPSSSFFASLCGSLRLWAVLIMVAFQVAISCTGNYGFFNANAAILTVALLSDANIPVWLCDLLRFDLSHWGLSVIPVSTASSSSSSASVPPLSRWVISDEVFSALSRYLVVPLMLAVLLFLLFMTTHSLWITHQRYVSPSWLSQLYEKLFPKDLYETIYYNFHRFSLWSSYGLFRTMTTNRTELVIEGSNDLTEWRVYEFKYKPTSLTRRPPVAFPHLPRLDWMLWFCQFRSPSWLEWFLYELLRGNRDVCGLLSHVPFPLDKPPTFLRVYRYEYRFSPTSTATGEWWSRSNQTRFCPILKLSKDGKSLVHLRI
mmetsp:Transcript_6874/g.17319  ORF Transcript_6874/g.17319 Transcript_6874/m.17319 type:complete len:642 (+) Transcript_6874:58-1983(+)|eukprot:CAMPEP_0177657122 /NCGR_PEP_ID=MMETSP0447-20121125/15999_1 /TAXON_ID=0 /ORGANISM="Stygamoeba regulata, Strain BSH-02190019" /LENGTH=641 /DNA_ID=CAMNT_0019161421 /DNA_START=42 /DNA_END=1967 /DNA_ORIENTATION=+